MHVRFATTSVMSRVCSPTDARTRVCNKRIPTILIIICAVFVYYSAFGGGNRKCGGKKINNFWNLILARHCGVYNIYYYHV